MNTVLMPKIILLQVSLLPSLPTSSFLSHFPAATRFPSSSSLTLPLYLPYFHISFSHLLPPQFLSLFLLSQPPRDSFILSSLSPQTPGFHPAVEAGCLFSLSILLSSGLLSSQQITTDNSSFI